MTRWKIAQLNNKNGDHVFPVTSAQVVYMEDGRTSVKDKFEEFGSQLEHKVNKINKIETINAKEIGADNKGVISCTDLIQNYINNGYSIYFPQGIYKLNISLAPKITIQGEGLGLVTLIPEDLNKDVIKEPVNIPDKFVKIPKRVEHTKTINVRNGRVYKELGNGYGVYSDDGSVFKI